MDKTTQKKRDNKRIEAVKIVAAQFDCTTRYVNLIIDTPTYYYGTSQEVRRAYEKVYAQLKQILA